MPPAFYVGCGYVPGLRVACTAPVQRGLVTENFAGSWMDKMQAGTGRAIDGFIAPFVASRTRPGNAGLNGQGRIWAAEQNELVHPVRLPPAGPCRLS